MLFEAVSVLLLIFLTFLLLLMVTTSGVSPAEWSRSGMVIPPQATESPLSLARSNMFAGPEGVLYTIDGHNIHAINGSGAVLWNVTIPDVYTVRMRGAPYNLTAMGNQWNGLSMTEANGTLIFMAEPVDPKSSYLQGAILAISPGGRLLWTRPFTNSGDSPYNTSSGYIFGFPKELIASNGSLYVYSGSYEAVLSTDGTVRWYIDTSFGNGFYGNPSVDESGDVYTMVVGYNVTGHYPNGERSNATIDDAIYKNYTSTIGLANGTILAGNYDTVQAYYANGSPKWRLCVSDLGLNDPLKPPYALTFDHQPIYHNGTLYVGLPHTVLALDRDGRLKWQKRYGQDYFNRVWFDSRDNAYLQFSQDLSLPERHIFIIRPDGTETELSSSTISELTGLPSYPVFNDDTVYQREWSTPLEGKVDLNYSNVTYENYDSLMGYPWERQHDLILQYLRDHNGSWDFPRRLHDLDTYEISAYDFKAGRRLWNYTIPLDTHETMLTRSNAPGLLLNPGQAAGDNNVSAERWYAANGIPYGSEGVGSMSRVDVLPTANATYMSFWSYCYEVPAIYDRSRIVYSGGIYAFGLNGNLLWKKETDSPVVSMKEVNGTIYYSTGNGGLLSTRAEVYAGFLTAFLYVFVRFFLAGAVTRARGLVNKNHNRNGILQFIVDNPGSGLYEISRGLKINKGTVRYHLLILSLNHRIVAYKADDRYVRYFTNSGTYSAEEQLAMALARRDSVRKVLAAILKKPGISIAELSRESGMQTSAVSRYVKELVDKGVVSKEQAEGGRLSYAVSSEYREPVDFAIGRLNGQ